MRSVIRLTCALLLLLPAAARADFSFDRTDFSAPVGASGQGLYDVVVSERHVGATPDKLTVLINHSLPPVTSPPGGGSPGPALPGLPSPAGPPSPITGLKGLKSTISVDRKGRATLGTATNPPTASTTETLTTTGAKAAAKRQTLGRGTTKIPAGSTRKIVVKLSAKALKRLKRARTLRVTLTIKATGPTGTTATVKRSLKLKRPR
jgi:hypothetical protein